MTTAIDRLYERVLVLRCQAGDDLAFGELVERYHRRLLYYVRRLLADADAADDVLQDVWLNVYRHIGGLRDAEALTVWLYRIARNAARSELRGLREWATLSDEPAAPQPAVDEPEFSGVDAARVHAALDRLRPEHRDVLTLRFLEQMSYQQISEVVGCPLGTTRSRIHYAKQALRRIMEG